MVQSPQEQWQANLRAAFNDMPQLNALSKLEFVHTLITEFTVRLAAKAAAEMLKPVKRKKK